jgi:hypothetical protein
MSVNSDGSNDRLYFKWKNFEAAAQGKYAIGALILVLILLFVWMLK